MTGRSVVFDGRKPAFFGLVGMDARFCNVGLIEWPGVLVGDRAGKAETRQRSNAAIERDVETGIPEIAARKSN